MSALLPEKCNGLHVLIIYVKEFEVTKMEEYSVVLPEFLNIHVS
jgi:hypothetical protein